MWWPTNTPVAEHPFMWIARKSHPTHFHNRYSRSSYQPKTNTEVLYDGSPEARALLEPVVDGSITTEGSGVRRHALDYLKGRNVERMGMWTYDIMQPDEPEVEELERLAIRQMVMDRSAVATEEEPKLVQITPAESSYFEESVEQNKELLERLADENNDL